MFHWQQAPWLWPRQMQSWLLGCVCCLSFFASCLWLGEGEAAERLQAQQVQHELHLKTIATLQAKLLTTQKDFERIVQTIEQKRLDTLSNVMQHQRRRLSLRLLPPSPNITISSMHFK